MREIKFRAWSKGFQTMLQWEDIKYKPLLTKSKILILCSIPG